MVEKFDAFVAKIYEAKTLDDIPEKNRDMAGIFDGFKSMKDPFRYLGKFYWTNKSINAFIFPKVVEDTINKMIEDNINPIEEKIFGEKRTRIKNIDIYFSTAKYFGNNGDVKDEIVAKYGESMGNNIIKKRERMLNEYLSQIGTEKIFKFKDKGKLWYCFYNMSERYYYFVNVVRQSFGAYGDNSSNLGDIFEIWMKYKTENTKSINNEYEKYFLIKKQEEDEKEAEREIHRKKLEEMEKIEQFKKSIYNDYKKNPDNYKKTTWDDMPQDIADQLEKKGKYKTDDDCEYFEWGISGSYYANSGRGARVSTTTYYVNNRDMSDGYVYTVETYRSNWTGD